MANSKELSVSIDVSEALTGLKAVQREAKETVKALKEVEKAADLIKPMVYLDLSEVSHKQITIRFPKKYAQLTGLDTYMIDSEKLNNDGYNVIVQFVKIGDYNHIIATPNKDENDNSVRISIAEIDE